MSGMPQGLLQVSLRCFWQAQHPDKARALQGCARLLAAQGTHSLIPAILAILAMAYHSLVIGGLQRSGEQCIFADPLLGELRVDGAADQKQQTPHPRAPGRFDHMGLDLEVLQQKVRRLAAVGLDATTLAAASTTTVG